MAEKEILKAKKAAVAELAESFNKSNAAVLTEYRGLTVAQLAELRRSLGEGNRYQVTKNTLAKRAANDAGLAELEDLFTGPTAITFVEGDPVEAAKGLKKFSKTNDALVIKGGVMDGKILSTDDLNKIADLESREVLLAKLAGALKGTTQKAAGLFAAPASQVARLGAALRDKKEAAGE